MVRVQYKGKAQYATQVLVDLMCLKHSSQNHCSIIGIFGIGKETGWLRCDPTDWVGDLPVLADWGLLDGLGAACLEKNRLVKHATHTLTNFIRVLNLSNIQVFRLFTPQQRNFTKQWCESTLRLWRTLWWLLPAILLLLLWWRRQWSLSHVARRRSLVVVTCNGYISSGSTQKQSPGM